MEKGHKLNELALQYLPLQDRILLNFMTTKKEIILWITRRISKEMVMQITSAATTSNLKKLSINEKIMMNHYERDIAQSRKPIQISAKKLDNKFIEGLSYVDSLVQKFEIKKIDNCKELTYELFFLEKSRILLKLKTDKQNLLNFQTALIKKIESAKW